MNSRLIECNFVVKNEENGRFQNKSFCSFFEINEFKNALIPFIDHLRPEDLKKFLFSLDDIWFETRDENKDIIFNFNKKKES